MAFKLDSNSLGLIFKKVKDNIPTATSDLTNDSGFITTSDIPEGAAASTTSPKMAGEAAVGTEMAFARGDHVHPSEKDDILAAVQQENYLKEADLTTLTTEEIDTAWENA